MIRVQQNNVDRIN